MTADVAESQRRIIGSQTRPSAETLRGWALHTGQAGYPFHTMALDIQAIECLVAFGAGGEVHIPAIMRPFRGIYAQQTGYRWRRRLGELGPFLGLPFKQCETAAFGKRSKKGALWR